MHWYKTLAWWVIFRCQYTLTSNNQLWGCLVLFSAVDAVAKHSSVNKTTLNAVSRFPKAFVSSAGILNLPITSIPVDNFNDRALWCKPTGINYNMHGWILCRYCATGWFWWIRGLRAVTMWSSSSFTKRWVSMGCQALIFVCGPIMYTKCHVCMLAPKVYKIFKALALWKTSPGLDQPSS